MELRRQVSGSDPRTGLTVREACAFLGCSRATLSRERAAGLIKPDGFVASRPRFKIETLLKYMRAQRARRESRGAR